MTRSSISSRSAKSAATLLSSLVIFALTFCGAYYYLVLDGDLFENHPLEVESGHYERFWLRKLWGPADATLLILGDSRVAHGVSPTVLAEQFDEHRYRGLNFGFYGAGYAPLMFERAERRLDKKARERIIVVGVTPLSLTASAEKNESIRLYLKTSWLLAQFYIHFPRWAGRLLTRGIPYEVEQFPGKLGYHEDGWLANSVTPEDFPDDINLGWIGRHYDEYPVRARFGKNLCEKTREWREGGIHVVGFRPPVSRAMRKLEDERAGFDEAEFVEQFERNGGLWIEIDHSSYESYDNSHLQREEALKLSTELGQKIQARLKTR